MDYAISYFVRFQGTLTQGPNKGQSFTWESSWGGIQHFSLEEAQTQLAQYKALEPNLEYKLFSRQYVSGRRGKKAHFQETEIV